MLDGSFDTSFFGTGASQPGNAAGTYIGSISLRFGPIAADFIAYSVGNVFTNYTIANVNLPGNFDGGDAFGMINSGSNDLLRLPANYLSGASLHSEGTWSGSIGSLSLKIGTTTMFLPGEQKLIINVVDPSLGTVPEPASLALAALALGGLALSRRRARP